MALQFAVDVNRYHRAFTLREGAIKLGRKHKLCLFFRMETAKLRGIRCLVAQFFLLLMHCLVTHAERFQEVNEVESLLMLGILPDFVCVIVGEVVVLVVTVVRQVVQVDEVVIG